MKQICKVIGFASVMLQPPAMGEKYMSPRDVFIDDLGKCIQRYELTSNIMSSIADTDARVIAEYSRFSAYNRRLKELKQKYDTVLQDLGKSPNSEQLKQAAKFYTDRITDLDQKRQMKIDAVFEHMFGRVRKSEKLRKAMLSMTACKQLTYTPDTRAQVCAMPDNTNTKWCKMAF